MTKTATEVMQEVIFSVVIDAVAALKTASKGLPNTLLRDINAIHANVTFADLPPEVQAMISTSVRAAFTRLLKEGYSVAPSQGAPPRNSPPQGQRVDRGSRSGPAPLPGKPPMRRDGPGGGDDRRRPPSGGRPNRKPGGRPR
jgi:hypothetical protein